ncbi:ParB/RepB/Spo0J family partition protein [Brachybacterium huguangmaarense]
MTQKRGLGRGLGALIPGGEAASARRTAPADVRPSARNERAAEETPTTVPGADDPAAANAAAAPADADDAALRTRVHPRTAPEPGEAGSAVRPVDMFFSGDPVSPADRPASRGGAGRDVAGAMARAAAERRAAGRKPAAARGGSADGEATTDGPAKPAAKTTQKKTTKTATTRKAATGTSTTADASAAPTKAMQGTSTQNKPAAKTSTPKQPAPAETTTAETPMTAAPVEAAASAPDSPVEVERVTPTPARPATPAESAAPASGAPASDAPASDAPASDAPAVAAPESPEAGNETDGTDQGTHHEDLLPVPGAEFAEIPIHEIRENPRNPRTQFDDDALDELAYSLREVGVLQPVVVRPIPATDAGESFELVMGERRWRAARRAGLPSIPAIIRETSDDDLLRDALLENLHRSQLNPLEEAAAYQQLLEDFGCTQDELAERIGRSRPQISNTLRLMKLPPLVQRRLASGALSAGHARALLPLESAPLMEELAQRIVAEGLSVRAVERLVSRGAEPERARTAPRRTSYDPRVVNLTSRLATRVEAPVRIDVGKRKGRVTLEFTNLEDLERLLHRIGIDVDDLGDESQGSVDA